MKSYSVIKQKAKEFANEKRSPVYIAKAKKQNHYKILFSQKEVTPRFTIIETVNPEQEGKQMADGNKKFNLTELLNQRSKEIAEAEEKNPEAAQEIEETEKAIVDIYDIIPSKDNFYDTESGIEWLAQSIELVGLIEPLAVMPDGDKYRLISGHRRRLALIKLVEQGKERFRKVECSIKDKAETEEDRILQRLAMIMANGYRDKTDWERMKEAIETKDLVLKLKEKMEIGGRTRDLLAEIIKSTPAQVGRYEAIYNNIIPELMAVFKENKMGVSAIYEASGMKREWQQKVFAAYEEKGELQISDVLKLKKQEKESEPIPGQQEIFTEKEKEQEQRQQEEETDAPQQEEEQETEEEPYFEPEPESVVSICYSCQRYSECHEKKSTVTNCNAYINKAEAEKTEEQKYDEEQKKIDAETKKKMQERQQEEKMNNLPGEVGKKEHNLRLAASRYEEITSQKLRFLLLKKDGYSVGEEIELPEYENGKPTGRMVEIKISYIWEDWTGLDDDYCIIGFDLVSWS